MLLHDSFFFSSNQSVNETHYSLITMAHSPLFHSTLTLIISLFGICSNFLCMIYLSCVISQYKQRKLKKKKAQQTSIHILSHKKYRFLVMITSNDFLLCLSSVISCLDEKYFSQTLIARYHLCSFHILIWKFTLHFTPLLLIFLLIRYHYLLNKRFPVKCFHTTTFNQLFYTDLCTLIPFVIALAWSVDGLWLWGETNMGNFVTLKKGEDQQNQPKEVLSSTTVYTKLNQSDIKLGEQQTDSLYLAEQKIICHLQTYNDLNFTARILHLIQADFLLLFGLHFIGLFLEILLHIRLCCCSITRKIQSSFLQQQQLSLYISYIFVCLTVTSLPFYFYRTIEILFDSNIPIFQYDLISNRTLAQIILCGISIKPILYLVLLCPSKILFKFKCYALIKLDQTDRIDGVMLVNQLNQKQNRRHELDQERYSLNISSCNLKIHVKQRTVSDPTHAIIKHHSIIIDSNTSNAEPKFKNTMFY